MKRKEKSAKDKDNLLLKISITRSFQSLVYSTSIHSILITLLSSLYLFKTNRDQKKAGVAILISDKIDFKTKTVKRDKDGHYIMIKGSIQEEDITIINIYAPNIEAPQYIRQMLTGIKGEIYSYTIIVENYNIPLTPMQRSCR